jgi:hypothetical protein
MCVAFLFSLSLLVYFGKHTEVGDVAHEIVILGFGHECGPQMGSALQKAWSAKGSRGGRKGVILFYNSLGHVGSTCWFNMFLNSLEHVG